MTERFIGGPLGMLKIHGEEDAEDVSCSGGGSPSMRSFRCKPMRSSDAQSRRSTAALFRFAMRSPVSRRTRGRLSRERIALSRALAADRLR